VSVSRVEIELSTTPSAFSIRSIQLHSLHRLQPPCFAILIITMRKTWKLLNWKSRWSQHRISFEVDDPGLSTSRYRQTCILFAAVTGGRWAEMGLHHFSPFDFWTKTLPSWLCVLFIHLPSSLGLAYFYTLLHNACFVCVRCTSYLIPHCTIQAQKSKQNRQNSQFNSFSGTHPTSKTQSPYCCSTTFPILTDVFPDPQSPLTIYCLVLQLLLRVGIDLLSPGPRQAPGLTKPPCRPWRWRPEGRRGPMTRELHRAVHG
jgi:hypothetical protein